jgi:prevent-host-death family protein
MATEISIEALGSELRNLLDRVPSGESVTVIGADGKPVARVIPLRPQPEEAVSDEDWLAEWDALAEEVGKTWKGGLSAVEAVAEQRR